MHEKEWTGFVIPPVPGLLSEDQTANRAFRVETQVI